MGNNSLFMDQTIYSKNNKLYYIPTRRNISFVSSPESIYNNNNYINNINSKIKSNINCYTAPKKIIDKININNNSIKNNKNYYISSKQEFDSNNNHNKLNSSFIEIIKNNSYSSDNSQCYGKCINNNILSNLKYYKKDHSQERQYIRNTNNKNINIKTIHTHSVSFQPTTKEINCDKEKHIIKNPRTLVNHKSQLNNPTLTQYPLLSEKKLNHYYSVDRMKSQTSLFSHLPLDSFNSQNESMVSPFYVSPMYYASSVPLTVTTTANANMNNSDVSSLISSYFCDNDEQYVVDDSNTITYIVNSNHDEKSISMTPPSNNESFINTITASNSPSSINNICYNQPNKMNNNNGIRSSNNNTQIKSLLPMKYYNNNSINRIYMLNSSPMNTSSTIPTNTTSMKDSNNNTQTIVIKNEDETISMNHLQQQITTTTASSSPRLNSIINSPHTTTTTTTTTTIATTTSETSYTNLEQEKIRGPMMYSTTGNNTNVMNLSPRITNIITSQTSASNQHKNITNMGTSSPVSSSSSSTISIISVASGQSNVALKDSILTCSSDSSQISDTNGDTVSKKDKSSKTSTKQSKNKSTTNLCGKSGIVGFAAEILTSVLPTSNNNLKHPKTRYLPELYPFIKKITHKCKIDIRTFLYALVYSQRFAEALLSFHKEAVGEYGTNHRIFLGSLLLAYQYQINHGMKVDFKLDAKKLSKLTDGVWTEKEVEMMCKALLSTKNFTVEINDDVVKQFVETHKADLCWYS